MTTCAAILGALPLAIGLGQGASLRQPLGLTIIGGLIVSQALTLYTTPVVYVFMDRLGTRLRRAPEHGAAPGRQYCGDREMKRIAIYALAAVAGAGLNGCMVGPNYQKPAAIVPVAYKEAPGWTQAQPEDAMPKGDWWTLYNDPDLNRLEPLVIVSNQTLAADYFAYQQALAIVAETQGGLYPTVGLTGSATRSAQGNSGGGNVSTNAGSGAFSFSSGGPRTSGTLRGQRRLDPGYLGQDPPRGAGRYRGGAGECG